VIAEADALSLPPGVRVERGSLADSVRGTAWPLNGSGAFVFERTGISVGQIARELADAFALPIEAARRDVLSFAWHLNALALVNVERKEPLLRRCADWLVLLIRLAPAGAFPARVARRRALDTRTTPRAIGSCLLAVFPRTSAVAGISIVAMLPFLGAAGASGIGVALALGLATGLGLGLHEAGHAALLRGVPSALVVRGRRTFVLHAAVGESRRSVVAVAGPLVAALVGVAFSRGGAGLAEPGLALAGCPLAAHALALTVVGGDGRIACRL
jgi:hypothetical protein